MESHFIINFVALNFFKVFYILMPDVGLIQAETCRDLSLTTVNIYVVMDGLCIVTFLYTIQIVIITSVRID
jgi:hypothetical protein